MYENMPQMPTENDNHMENGFKSVQNTYEYSLETRIDLYDLILTYYLNVSRKQLLFKYYSMTYVKLYPR